MLLLRRGLLARQVWRRSLCSATAEERFAADDAPSLVDLLRLQKKFVKDAAKAQMKFSVTGNLWAGLRSCVSVREKHAVIFDEPESLGGAGTAPNPVEVLLASLATCQDITYKAFARSQKTQLDAVSSSFVGELDLRGFFGVDDRARPGLHTIKGQIEASCPGMEPKSFANLKAVVDRHCPVLDSLVNPVPVNLSLKCIKVDAAREEEDDAPSAEDIGNLQTMFKNDKAAAQARFKTRSELTSGLRSRATIRDIFRVQADEAKSLGGTDLAPNPVEIFLASLAGCQEITYKAYARAMGLEITRVSCALTGSIDLRGFLAVAPYDVARPGFRSIDGEVTIESTASEEVLKQLKQAVEAHCPVLDMIENKVPVIIESRLKQ